MRYATDASNAACLTCCPKMKTKISARTYATHLDAKRILQSPLKDGENGVGLQIDDEIRTTCKHPERALAQISTGRHARIRWWSLSVPFPYTGGGSDGEDDDLKSMPRPAPLHALIREITHGIDSLVPDALCRLVFERMEQDTLEF